MTALTDNRERGRFELDLGDTIAFVNYRESPGQWVLTHAEVPPAYEGRGVGSRLASLVLEAARARQVRVVPACSFIAAYIARHPEVHDLLA